MDDSGEMRDDVVEYGAAPVSLGEPASDEGPEGEAVVGPKADSGRRGEIVEKGTYRVMSD